MIGDFIKKQRKELGLTQAQLAAQIGVEPQSISLYEQDKRSVNYDILKRFSEIFHFAFVVQDGEMYIKKTNQEGVEVSMLKQIKKELNELLDILIAEDVVLLDQVVAIIKNYLEKKYGLNEGFRPFLPYSLLEFDFEGQPKSKIKEYLFSVVDEFLFIEFDIDFNIISRESSNPACSWLTLKFEVTNKEVLKNYIDSYVEENEVQEYDVANIFSAYYDEITQLLKVKKANIL